MNVTRFTRHRGNGTVEKKDKEAPKLPQPATEEITKPSRPPGFGQEAPKEKRTGSPCGFGVDATPFYRPPGGY